MRKVCQCTICPMGCEIEIFTDENGNITEIKGGLCNKGRNLATQTTQKPMQILTTTIALSEPVGEIRVVPVKTSKPVYVDNMKEIIEVLKNTVVSPPVKAGTVIVENIRNLGVDIIITRSIGTS